MGRDEVKEKGKNQGLFGANYSPYIYNHVKINSNVMCNYYEPIKINYELKRANTKF